jgi:hypothetical protein
MVCGILKEFNGWQRFHWFWRACMFFPAVMNSGLVCHEVWAVMNSKKEYHLVQSAL